VGRHGGRSGDHPDHEFGSSDHTIPPAGTMAPPRPHSGMAGRAPVRSTAGIAPATGGGKRWWDSAEVRAAAPAGHPWWDDAPVPPPVVVASADGRTPAMTFTPDADPFSAGGLFAPPVACEDEPAVVVHPAPDAAVSGGSRRARSAAWVAADAVGSHQEVLNLLRDRDDGPDTGSLVRPYVTLADLAAAAPAAPAEHGDPDAEGADLTDFPDLTNPDGLRFDLEPVRDPRPARRARRSGGPLDRIIDVAPPAPPVPPAARPVQEWQAPWAADEASSPESGARSLFEPASPGSTNAWAAPGDQSLPSRKALRARERASASSSPDAGLGASARDTRLTGRRLAKTGVLAVTAVGVVAASAPNAFSALGWRLPPHAGGATSSAALVSLGGSGALPASDLTLGSQAGSALLGATGSLSAPNNGAAAQKQAVAAARASAQAAARAGKVASGAGHTLVDVARSQVAAEAERKARIAQQVSRNIVRDPRAYARLLLQQRGWSGQFTCLNLLWNRESGWNYQAYNPSSGAYGIPQALPGSKMASIASDWRTNPATQIKWGLNYIAERYGTPCGAWGHSQATGWY
jgi:hypothetical protein